MAAYCSRVTTWNDIESLSQRVGGVGFQAASLPKKTARQIFVAYPYRLYPKADYRKVYKAVEDAFDVKFVYADEQITNLTILEKIKGYILESEFGIYDISGWNANVTLELGLAFGLGESAFIVIDPTKNPTNEAPADLRGLDRIQYESYNELEEKLGQLVAQEMPVPRTHDAENQLVALREQVMQIVDPDEGLKIGDVATALGISTELAQLVVRPLVGDRLRTEGQKRGTRYFRVH